MSPTRRQFLLLRPARHARVVELPCRRLYMRYVEARTAAGRTLEGGAAAGGDPGEGEPPSEVETPSVEALFATLQRELDDAEAVRLVDADWLTELAFKQEVDRVLDLFRARGGRIEK